MTSPLSALKPTADATRSWREASSASVRGRHCCVAASIRPSTRTATVIRVTAPGARTTSRCVSDTSKLIRSRVSLFWLLLPCPSAPSPSGKLEATVTAPVSPADWLERSSVSVLIATRLSGSNRRSVICSLAKFVSTETSTIARPWPTCAANKRSTRAFKISARSAPASESGTVSSKESTAPVLASITATLAASKPSTADATRKANARDWSAVIASEAGVTKTEAEGGGPCRKGCPAERFEMCTRTDLANGAATIVRANSPSFARQYAASNIWLVVPKPDSVSNSS